MDILEAIATRRSIRKYTGEAVSEENLKTILKSGFYAPSAHNCQPWHFVIVRKPSMLEDISKAHKYGKMLPQAGCGIIVCGDKEKQPEHGFLIEDCAAAIENMLLAAHGLGLGAVWCGLYPIEVYTRVMTQLLSLPEHIIPVGMVVVGHKNEEKRSVDRFDETKVHYEQW